MSEFSVVFAGNLIFLSAVTVAVCLCLIAIWVIRYRRAVSGKRTGCASASRKVEQGSNLGELDRLRVHPEGKGVSLPSISCSPKRNHMVSNKDGDKK